MKYALLLFAIGLLSCSSKPNDPYVLLVSIDGFRHDYAEKYQATNILAIANEGVKANSLIACYPSKTFSNHYSIATGLYPDNHGIVDSYFYEPLSEEYFSPRKASDGKWFSGTPLWNLAEQQGIKTAAYHWIGSEAEIGNQRPSYFETYDPKVTPEQKVTQVIEWLELPIEDRPRLICPYFSIVDQAGHDYGVDSPELERSVLRMDSLIGVIRSETEKLGLSLNIILVSDHGMTNPDYDNMIDIESMVSFDSTPYVMRDTHTMIYDSSLYEQIIQLEDSRFDIYKFSNLPKGFHYSKTDRLGELILVARPPFVFGTSGEGGSHGYPVNLDDMHGIFYAAGPNFKSDINIESFENIHIYPTIATILNLPYDSLSIDGNINTLRDVILVND